VVFTTSSTQPASQDPTNTDEAAVGLLLPTRRCYDCCGCCDCCGLRRYRAQASTKAARS